jgi:hypothetical protein
MMGTLVQNGPKDNTVQVADDLHYDITERPVHGHSEGTDKILPWIGLSARGLG